VPSFFTPPTFTAGGDANVVVADDFNGDGVRDLAVGNQNTVSILLAGPGGYKPPIVNSAGTSLRDLIAADLTGDGFLDLAVVNSTASANVHVLKGNGDGTFQSVMAYSVGNSLRAVVAGDFDADGDLDLATANFLSRNLAILRNAGDGTFTTTTVAVNTYPQDLTVGDFDADGDLDLVTVGYFWDDGTYDERIVAVLGNGSGDFVPSATYDEEQPLAVTSGDFDADGDFDLAVGGFYGKLSIWLNTGTGSFASLNSQDLQGATSIDAKDLTGDGKLDLLVTGSPFGGYPGVGVLAGAGDGSFQIFKGYVVTVTSKFATAADLDNDTKLDVVVANGAADVVTVLRNLGSGLLQGVPLHPSGGLPHAVVPTDLNADGHLDLTVTNSANHSVSVLLGTSGGFQSAVSYSAGSTPRNHAIGDFDGNGIPDLAVPNDINQGTVTVLLGKGDGTFMPPRVYSAGMFAKTVVVADFTGDGIEDLAVTNRTATGTVSILRGTGTGRFRAGVPHSAGSFAYGLAAADFDGDGDQDLAVTNDAATNTLRVLLNNGNGTFQELILHAGADAEGVVATDFNQDGRPDIATVSGDFNACRLNVFLGNGDGTFQTPNPYILGGWALSLATGDIDGNGTLDIAVAGRIGHTIHVFLNDGAAQFQSGEFDGGKLGYGIAVADLNNDDHSDVAFTTPLLEGGVVVLANDGVWPPPSPLVGPRLANGLTGVAPLVPPNQAGETILPPNDPRRHQPPQQFSCPHCSEATRPEQATRETGMRIIRRVAAHSDQLADDMIMNWNI
jgi:hypothetical protein